MIHETLKGICLYDKLSKKWVLIDSKLRLNIDRLKKSIY